jgi:hypothetical protein
MKGKEIKEAGGYLLQIAMQGKLSLSPAESQQLLKNLSAIEQLFMQIDEDFEVAVVAEPGRIVDMNLEEVKEVTDD